MSEYLKLPWLRTHRVDLVDPFPALVTLPSDPVAVEVGTDPVQDLTGEAVVLPLLGVELEHALVHQVLAVLQTERRVLELWRDGDADTMRTGSRVLTFSRLVK